MQACLKGLFPLYTLAEVQCLPGCVLPLIRLELQRHLSLKTLTILHMQSYLCLLKQSIMVGFLMQLRVHNLLFPLFFKEGRYILQYCLFVTSPFWKEDTGFVLASVKLQQLSPAHSNRISHKGKLVYCQYRKSLRHNIDTFCMYLMSSSPVHSIFIYAQS